MIYFLNKFTLGLAPVLLNAAAKFLAKVELDEGEGDTSVALLLLVEGPTPPKIKYHTKMKICIKQTWLGTKK